MTYQELNKKSIEDAFEDFIEKCPNVYQTFKDLALTEIDKGRKKVSAKQIIGFMRWQFRFKDKKGKILRINDAFTAHFSRRFVADKPEYKTFFEFRKLRS